MRGTQKFFKAGSIRGLTNDEENLLVVDDPDKVGDYIVLVKSTAAATIGGHFTLET